MSSTSDLFALLGGVRKVAHDRGWIKLGNPFALNTDVILASTARHEIVIGRLGIKSYNDNLKNFQHDAITRYRQDLNIKDLLWYMDGFLMEHIRNGVDRIEYNNFKISFYSTETVLDEFTQSPEQKKLCNTFYI